MLGFSWRAAGRTLSLALATTVMVAAIVPPGAMAVESQSTTEQISGKVKVTSGYWEDAQISAVAFSYDAATSGWNAVADTVVASDGTYSIDLPSSGTYRVGYFDAALVYADDYYAHASKVESATDIPVAAGQQVSSIDDTLTALPEYIIEGRIAFAGESTPSAGVGVTVYTYDPATGANALVTRRTRSDGTYRIHLPGVDVANGYTGTYRIGFTDFDDVFGPVYYNQASKIESATPVIVNVAGTRATGVDATMSAQGSTRMTAKDSYRLSVVLSQRFESGSGGTVVLASGTSWRDMLVAGPLAHSLGGPLLATGKSSVPSAIKAELMRLAPTQVVIVGGPTAVSLAEEVALRGMGIPVVRRVYGSNAEQTAVQAADEMINSGTADGSTLALAPFETATPSLGAAAVAIANDTPIVFTRKSALPKATSAFFARRSASATLVFGGSSIVRTGVTSKLPGVVRYNSNVPSGVATKSSAYGIKTCELSDRLVGLVSSARPVDALLADSYFGARRITAVVTAPNRLDPTTAAYLAANKGSFARVIAVGSGNPAFGSATFRAASNAIK